MAFTESLLALSISRETPELIREEPRVGSKAREMASAQVEARQSATLPVQAFPRSTGVR
jgi:hypothetical protein